ncbi:MAG: helix-turn-helix transcriptional regulator [Eubacterium sp.]|nr:helix-turn-helix transcriptional regulator [Eubacterium sp.]
MEHDIGSKIKAARLEKKLTQEQVAEILGVSRQTISNWENEKSYPDIISVIKMSDCYEVSLDYLLKGEQKMKTYYDYLEESTNVVKSNTNRNKIITILPYLLIWAVAMIVFWFFTSGSDAMGYSLMFLWIILPVTTFVVSIVIGKNDFREKGKWAFTLFFGVMYMLAEYGTFKMANNIAFDKLNAPDWGMIVVGAIISAIGMLIGSLFNKKRNKQKKQDI